MKSYIQSAQKNGAKLHLRTGQMELWYEGAEVKGLQTGERASAFDLVVLAAGGAVDAFLSKLGPSLGLQISPVVLLRYSCKPDVLQNVISSPELEIRQAADGTLLIVEDFFPGCEQQDFAPMRERLKIVMSDYLRFSGHVVFQSGAVGRRPMLPAGRAERGFVGNFSGLYYLVGHPGVILAPLLAREAAEEIMRTTRNVTA